jgi:hypothetical protein
MRPRRVVQIRRIKEWLALTAAIALIPWTIYLGLTLPQNYTAQHWPATWVGFDLLLLAFMIVTATLGFIRHHWLAIFAFATGVLLLCDAWFDVMTAKRGDFALSLATALFLELPLAIVLIGGSLRIASLQVRPLGRMKWPAPWRRAGRSSRRSTRLGPI